MILEQNSIILDTESNDLNGLPIEIAYGFVSVGKSEEGKPSISFNPENNFEQRYSIGDAKISWGAMAVHHITPTDLIGKPDYTTFELPEGVEYIIGHNIDYDVKAIATCGVDTSNIKSICTLALARHVWPNLDAHNLSALIYFICNGSDKAREMLKNAHSASADINLTANLLHTIVKATNISSMQELWELSEKARVPTHMHFGKHRGVAIADLPPSYVTWLLKQEDLDPYLRQALIVS